MSKKYPHREIHAALLLVSFCVLLFATPSSSLKSGGKTCLFKTSAAGPVDSLTESAPVPIDNAEEEDDEFNAEPCLLGSVVVGILSSDFQSFQENLISDPSRTINSPPPQG